MTLSVPHVKAHLVLNSKSGVSEDNAVWTLYYRPPGGSIPIDPGSGSVAVDNLAAAISHFLGSVPAGLTLSVVDFLAPSIMRGFPGAELKLYAIPINPVQVLGPPFATRLITIPGTPPTGGFPAEVASCLTYHADLNGIPERGPNNTRPASSRRGRIYLGPLTGASGVANATTGWTTVATNFRDTALGAAGQFLKGEAGNASWQWVVFSKKNWEVHDVKGAWMNDAFDTQRRRGQDPTVKTSVTFGS